MRKGFRIALAFVLVAIATGLMWLVLRKPAEPVYQGKPLSAWLQALDPSGPVKFMSPEWIQASNAICHIGTNAIPTLLEMLQAKDSALTLKIISLAQKQHVIKVNHLYDWQRVGEAMWGFQALGASASNAVPELIKIYSQNKADLSRGAIAGSLGDIGPPARSALPLLLKELGSNTNGLARGNTLWALGLIHAEPETVVPVLTRFLNDPSKFNRMYALQSLENFGMNSVSATFGILELIRDQDLDVRQSALHALSIIYGNKEWDRLVSTGFNPEYQSSTLITVINDFGAMGTNAKPAIPALVKFLADPDEQVRTSAAAALKAIDPEGAAKAGVK